MLVSDTSPLIAFFTIGRMDILKAIAGEVLIPEGVYVELVEGDLGNPSRADLERETWVKRRSVGPAPNTPGVHTGERDAATLALELGVPLLIDEAQGRRFALGLGIEVIGTLGVISLAKRRGILAQAKPLLDDLVKAATG